MAITRRQFVGRLSTLAAAAGISQSNLTSITDALGHGSVWTGPWTDKPKVIWIHGAECTGCSTSLLGLFEDVRGIAVEETTITTLAALDLAVGGSGDGAAVLTPTVTHPSAHRTLENAGLNVDTGGVGAGEGVYVANIADVLLDFIDLQYHETVMSMGGDLAYQWLKDVKDDGSSAPFVLVVEGALQFKGNGTDTGGGYWQDFDADVSWCSIGKDYTSTTDHDMGDTVKVLAEKANCAAVIAVGQCATYGGYPGCESPTLNALAGNATTDYGDLSGAVAGSMTGAQGVYDYLVTNGTVDVNAFNKVVNVPGCPTNPWWIVLTIVAWLVDFTNCPREVGGTGPLGILSATGTGALDVTINASAVDSVTSRRLNAVFGPTVHGSLCPRIAAFKAGVFATKPGDPGCLKWLGCKGLYTNSLCSLHGWNAQQPRNDRTWDYDVAEVNDNNGYIKGGSCVAAGSPCMGCTEKGYPDSYVPFIDLDG